MFHRSIDKLTAEEILLIQICQDCSFQICSSSENSSISSGDVKWWTFNVEGPDFSYGPALPTPMAETGPRDAAQIATAAIADPQNQRSLLCAMEALEDQSDGIWPPECDKESTTNSSH